MEESVRSLERDLTNPRVNEEVRGGLWQRVTEVKSKLTRIVEDRVRKRWEVSWLAHFECSEGCSKLLAWKAKKEQVRNRINLVKCDQTGNQIGDNKGIEQAFHKYYSKVYQEDLNTTDEEARLWLGQGWANPLSSEKSKQLNKKINLREVEQAVGQGKKGKAPRPDGLPQEVYKALAKVLTPIVVK